MKYSLIILLLVTTTGFAQLSLSEAKVAAEEHSALSYSYHVDFEGHQGYAAPIILTVDGGAIFFADAADTVATYEENEVNIIKLNNTGEVEWQLPVKAKHDEMETQSIVQDKNGDYYGFILSYNYRKSRGSTERVIHFDKAGNILWDRLLGDYTLKDNPHCSYIHLLADSRLEIRGHIVTEPTEEVGDPEYHFWTGWLNDKGELTQQIGNIIDWADPDWKKFYAVEKNE